MRRSSDVLRAAGARHPPGTATTGAALLAVSTVAAISVSAELARGPLRRLVVPLGVLVLLAGARRLGLTWREIGLAPDTWSRGARSGAMIAGPAVVLLAVAVALPPTRQLFLDDRHREAWGPALVHAFVAVPLLTVLPEEVAFRGVLLAVLERRFGGRRAVLGSAVLFGLWHLHGAWTVADDNHGLGDRLAPGLVRNLVATAGVLLVTGVAGLLFAVMRRRSGSLLAPMALHWAVNGTGTLAAALAWSLS